MVANACFIWKCLKNMVCFCPWRTALKISTRFSWSNICMHILQCLRRVPRTTGHQPALTMNLFRLMPAAFCQQPGSNTNRDSHKMPSTSSSVSILAVSRASLVCICHITWSRTLPFHHQFHPTFVQRGLDRTEHRSWYSVVVEPRWLPSKVDHV